MNKGSKYAASKTLINGLYTDYYELTMAQGYFVNDRHERDAVYDYFFRKNPFKGGFTVFAGMSDLVELIEQFTFDEDALDYLAGQGFRRDFLDYLADFRFSGNILAPREGELVFPTEPVARVEGTILETQLLETLLLNVLNFQSLIATKTARMRLVAGDRPVIDFGLRRAQGLAGIWASRAAVIGGAQSTSNVQSGLWYDIPVSGTQAHSWIHSFDEEIEAFRAFAKAFPDHCILLVDTYDTLKSGIPNAIRVAKEMKSKGNELKGIRLDSGDLAYLSKQARSMLDEEGLEEVAIVASNQLDEHVIKSLLQEQDAPIDYFGVGTKLITGAPDGALDGVYKLAFYDNKPRLKISENREKITLPGRKNVARLINDEGAFYGDVIYLEEEGMDAEMYHPFYSERHTNIEGFESQPVLISWMEDGNRVGEESSLDEMNAYLMEQMKKIPVEHKRFVNPHVYKVGISESLLDLKQRLVNQHRTS